MSNSYASGRIAIAICGRCSTKQPYLKLSADPNVPGLRVCRECKDQLDPYRLSPRQPDSFVLQYPRPDLPLDDLPPFLQELDGTLIELIEGGFLEENLV